MKPKTKIVHLVTSLGLGGTERQLVTLLQGLPADTFSAHVMCFRKFGPFLADLERLGLDPEHIDLHGSLLRPGTLFIIHRLARRLRELDAAVVHCHDVYAIVLGVPAARLAGIPVIAARRDLGHHVGGAMRHALRYALRQATIVLCNAATVASRVEHDDGIPAARLAVIPNGLDLAAFDARAATIDPPDPTAGAPGPTILTVARMTYPAKGHDDLLTSAARVVATHPTARFLLAGDGPREAELRAAAAKLGLADNIVFLGRRADVPGLLARVDLVCHPARMEGMPNAVLEAMAAGRPIVATAAGGTPELLHDSVHGLLVPPSAPETLADAILRLLADPARCAALGRAARARVEQSYQQRRLVERTARLYHALAWRAGRAGQHAEVA